MTIDRFGAMGTRAEVILHVDDDDTPTDLARAMVARLEGRWSRFCPTSDISRINTHAGRPVLVDPTTIDAVSAAVDAWEATAGLFDPTIGASLVAAGYDRPFEQLTHGAGSTTAPVTAPGADLIEVHRVAGTIRVPRGVALDLGGIGKGLTSDLVARALLDAGVRGALVNLGGDLRAEGEAPDGEGWIVILECPGAPQTRTIRLAQGAVCTSSVVKRCWSTANGPEHHLRHPATGRSIETDLVSASVIGARAAACEVLATCAVAQGLDRATRSIAAHGATGVLVHRDGDVVELDGFEAFT